MLNISKPAEKCSYRSTKKANMFKTKWLIERGVPATSNKCLDHLSRQFLTTASTFPYSSKNYSTEHIHALSTCLTLTNTLTHIDKHTHIHWLIHSLSLSLSLSLSQTRTHTHTHAHTVTHTGTCIKSVNMFGYEIFGAVWKGRGGGKEFSAEMTSAPGWRS